MVVPFNGRWHLRIPVVWCVEGALPAPMALTFVVQSRRNSEHVDIGVR